MHAAHHLDTSACEALGPAPCAQRPPVSSLSRGRWRAGSIPRQAAVTAGARSPVNSGLAQAAQGLPRTSLPRASMCGSLCPPAQPLPQTDHPSPSQDHGHGHRKISSASCRVPTVPLWM